MNVYLMLADSAQIAPNNKLYALGMNWTHIGSPTPPIALVVVIDVEQDNLPTNLQFRIELCDFEGNPAKVRGVAGQPEPVSLRVTGEQAVAPLQPHRAGEPVTTMFVVDIGAGLFLNPGIYSFELEATSTATGEKAHASRGFRMREPGEPG